jgi:hypothetical protein
MYRSGLSPRRTREYRAEPSFAGQGIPGYSTWVHGPSLVYYTQLATSWDEMKERRSCTY